MCSRSPQRPAALRAIFHFTPSVFSLYRMQSGKLSPIEKFELVSLVNPLRLRPHLLQLSIQGPEGPTFLHFDSSDSETKRVPLYSR